MISKITNEIIYTGVNDYGIDLFESHYPVPNGITYNSYVIKDEKTMVIATTSEAFIEEWMDNTQEALNGQKPDYLLIQHMEPDHSAAVSVVMEKYPDAVIAASKPALNMVMNYFGTDYAGRSLVIKEGDVLSLGKHEIVFYAAPMVHWPEVMFAYDKADKVLFSADAFGRFGAPLESDKNAASAEYEDEEWVAEARRYYVGIVGKQGPSVGKAFQKVGALDIRMICSLHGPVLTHDLDQYIDLQTKWATYQPESKGVAICYSSVYGHTKEAVELLADTIKEIHRQTRQNDRETAEELSIEIYDVSRCDATQAVAACFAYDRVVLSTTTYYNEIFPSMKSFINHLKDSAFQNRTVALIENGSWGPKAASFMKGMLEDCPDIRYCDTAVTIKSALNAASKEQIVLLAKELTVVQ